MYKPSEETIAACANYALYIAENAVDKLNHDGSTNSDCAHDIAPFLKNEIVGALAAIHDDAETLANVWVAGYKAGHEQGFETGEYYAKSREWKKRHEKK